MPRRCMHCGERTLPRLGSLLASLALVASVTACSDEGEVASEDEARVAYLGIDPGVDRALALGFDGFAAASNANIPDQTGLGDLSGTMVVGGKVDQGASANKEMDLTVAVTDYSDVLVEGEVDIRYFTLAPLILDMSLKGLPEAELTGTLTGTVDMQGAIEGPLTLNLSIMGQTDEGPSGEVRRAPGTTRITGTATSPNGSYTVDVTR